MGTPAPPAAPAVLIRLALSEDLVEQYQSQADLAQRTMEVVMAERLTRCLEYDDAKPLYFTDEQRQELEKALGRNVAHATDALTQIRKALSVRIGKVQVQLEEPLLSKLKSRCLGVAWDEYLTQLLRHALEAHVGLR
jgi:hypothetical protein